MKKLCFRQPRDDLFFTPTPFSPVEFARSLTWPVPTNSSSSSLKRTLLHPSSLERRGEAFDGDRFVLRPQHNPCSTELELPPSLPPSKLTPMRRVSLNKGDCFASSPRRHLSNSNNTCPRFDTSIKAERIGRRKGQEEQTLLAEEDAILPWKLWWSGSAAALVKGYTTNITRYSD